MRGTETRKTSAHTSREHSQQWTGVCMTLARVCGHRAERSSSATCAGSTRRAERRQPMNPETLSGEAGARSLQRSGWAILSSSRCQTNDGEDHSRSTQEPINRHHGDEGARMVSVPDLASEPRIENAECDLGNRGRESQHQKYCAKNQSDKCHC
jgi:hypothetical protein